MRLDKSSPTRLRLFSSLRSGRSLTKSARAAGVGKGPAQRWIREEFNELRDAGLSVLEAQELLGFASSLMPAWDHARLVSDSRHHLQRPIEVESAFWSAFESGASLRVAMGLAGVGRSTGYRWMHRRFLQLREDQVPVRAAALALRLDADRVARWEAERHRALVDAERAGRAAQHDAVLTAARHVQALLQPRGSAAMQARHARYWELIGQGHSNAEACKIMNCHPRTGRNIRRRGDPAKRPEQTTGAGRYLSLRSGCSTITAAITSAGTDGRPRPEGKRSANI